MDPEERRHRIRAEAANVHESATYSSETQFEYAKRWRSVDRWVGSVAAGLAAVAGIGGLSKVLSFGWAGTIAILSALIGAISASLSARQTTDKASVSANLYRGLQQDVRMFLQVDLDYISVEQARESLQQFVDRLQKLNNESVIPSDKAWRRAKKQIETGAQSYETEKEP